MCADAYQMRIEGVITSLSGPIQWRRLYELIATSMSAAKASCDMHGSLTSFADIQGQQQLTVLLRLMSGSLVQIANSTPFTLRIPLFHTLAAGATHWLAMWCLASLRRIPQQLQVPALSFGCLSLPSNRCASYQSTPCHPIFHSRCDGTSR